MKTENSKYEDSNDLKETSIEIITAEEIENNKKSIFFKNSIVPSQLPAVYLPESYQRDRQKLKQTLKPIQSLNSIQTEATDQPIMIPASSQESLPKDPLSFTLSPKIYLGSQSHHKKKVSHRITVDSSEQEEEEKPTEPKKRKFNHSRIISTDSDSDSSSPKIIHTKTNKKLKIRNQSNTITSSSSDTDASIIIDRSEGPDSKIINQPLKINEPRKKEADKTQLPVRKLINRRIASESDQESNDSSDHNWNPVRSNHRSDDEDLHYQTVTEDDALKFFNSCDVVELPGVTACTLEQAKMIVSCRPFKDADDVKVKLRKKKGVNSSVLNHYQEMMKGYFEVDRVLSKCEKHGEELFSIMNIWAGGVKTNKGMDTKVEGEQIVTEEAEGAIALVEHLKSAAAVRTEDEKRAFEKYIYRQPASVPMEVKLKDYQMLGINWLNLLYSKGLSCILADEMGLGKTAQVVCFLSHLKIIGKQGPHLVIVPSSTLENWMREFSNFSSNLIVRAYYGTQSERIELRYELKSMVHLDVVITTYNVATGNVEDRKFLDRMRFDACVYDEGHQLKNYQSKRYKDLMRQKVQWRLLLTGTPLQNNLQELVSLLSFILPKIFGGQAQNDLRMIFKVPTDAHVNLLAQTRITRAKKMMSPFVLRRKKDQVLKDLPKKIEKIVYCDLDPNQVEIYNQIIKKSKKHLSQQHLQGQPSKASDNNDRQNKAEEEEEEEDGVFVIDDSEVEDQAEKLSASPTNKLTTQQKTLAESTNTNVLMELRKASIHPMLFRRLYDNQVLKKIATSCLDEVTFFDSDIDLIVEDLQVMSDFEIHMFCLKYKSLHRYQLSMDHFFKSGKIQKLQEILTRIHLDQPSSFALDHNEDHDEDQKNSTSSRFLIFSQFTQVLQIIEQVLKNLNLKYLVLTGQTEVSERQELVDEFSEDETIKAFLLSTRAGGLGLNLTAADCVVLFDLDFNPHNDRQAEDRAYRLGQTKDVKVFKLISKGTIEEDVFQVASTKIQIDQSVSSSNGNHTINAFNRNINSNLNLIKNIKTLTV